MKSINFINPVPPQKQKELTYWFFGSIAILVLLIASLGILHYKSMRHYHGLRQELLQLTEITAQTESLKGKKERLLKIQHSLDQQLHMLAHQRTTGQAPYQLLANLARIIPSSCCLTKLDAQTNGPISIAGIGHNAKAIATFIDLLNACPQLDDPRLTTLTPSQKNTAFTIIGTWNLNPQSTNTEPWASLTA
jgi:Tfp pilus assembly protein PilN